MSNYTKTTNFAAKDSLPSGNAAKIVKGTEIDTEFNNIETASATKADSNNSTLTGTTAFETLSDGSISITAFVDEDNMASDSATLVPTQQSVKAYVDSQVTAQDLDVTTDSGTIAIDLDSETLTVSGGTGIDSSATGNAVTLAIDSTVATLTGSQTLSNKTLATPVVSGNLTTDGLIDGRDVATDGTKLDGIESGATADQTAAEIKTAYESNADTNAFTDADHSKLDGIEASADVTDTANVTAAGALMDSELTSEASVKALNQGVATTDSPTFAGVTAPITGNVTGNLTGNVTGNVTGDLTGDVTGDVTGNVTGNLTGSVLTAAQTNITSVGTLGALTVTGDVTVDTNSLKVDSTNNRVGILNASPDVTLDIGTATDAVHVPTGTTAQRPTGAAGYFRYNSTLEQFEGYTDAWGAIGGGGGSNLVVDTMTGDGSDTTLTLSNDPLNENNTQVYIDGVYQNKDTYSVSGTTLTFSTAPPSGSAVEAMTIQPTAVNVPADASVTSAKLSGDLVTPGALDVTGTVTADGLISDGSIKIERSGITTQYTTIESGGGESFIKAKNNASSLNQAIRFYSGNNVSDKERLNISSDGDISFYEDTGTTPKFFWDSSAESLGIGTTSPSEKLTIAGDLQIGESSGGEKLKFVGASGKYNFLVGKQVNVDNALEITPSTAAGGNTFSTPAVVVNSSGNVGIGTTSIANGLSLFKYGTQWTAHTVNTYPQPAGNIFFQMQAVANTDNWFGMTGNYGATTGSANLLLQANLNNTSQQAGHYIASQVISATASDLVFGKMIGGATTGDNSSKFEQMRIDSSGNVGIGTTSPSSTLHLKDTRAILRLESESIGGTTFDIRNGVSGGSEGGISFRDITNSATRMLIDSSGNLLVGPTSGSTHIIKKAVANGSVVLEVVGNNLGTRFYNADGGTPNAANTAVAVYSVGATGRSVNAAGTVNANGADYAEYERNNGLSISKGSIVGFKVDGTLTLTFSEAIRFAVKSTDPSFVGGDTWGTEAQVGAKPNNPTRIEDESDADFESRKAEYETDLATFEEALEAARQLVDRIAYSGKVPVNIQGATAGDYIIAVAADDGSINGQAVSDPDFTQYKLAVGRVNRILDDGRAEIAVIIH